MEGEAYDVLLLPLPVGEEEAEASGPLPAAVGEELEQREWMCRDTHSKLKFTCSSRHTHTTQRERDTEKEIQRRGRGRQVEKREEREIPQYFAPHSTEKKKEHSIASHPSLPTAQHSYVRSAVVCVSTVSLPVTFCL